MEELRRKLLIITALADTHAALWYLQADLRLSILAKNFMDHASELREKIAVSSISLVEILYLVEKGRLPAMTYKAVASAMLDPESLFTEAFLTAAIVERMRDIPRAEVSDMPDRIIAATALFLGVPIISRDRHIRSTLLETLW